MGISSALISSQEILRYIIFRPKVVYGILEHFSYNLPIRKLLVTFFCYLSLFPISILLHPQTSLTSPGVAWLYPFVQSCLVSPLCIGAMLEYSEAVPTLSVISNSIFNVYPQVRQAHAPLEEAIECLDKGIARGDVIRKNKFDVYLPPRRYYEGDVNCRIVGSGESRRETTDDKRIDGLVFLPGMWVNHASYATCATRLAKSGLVVVVISAEPLQLPTHLLGAGFADIEIAKKWVEKELRSRGSKASIDWSLGGHSMGAYTSLKLAYKNRCAMRKLVIWGAGSFPERVPDLSECIDLNILSVHASLDRIARFESKELFENYKAKLPTGSVFFHIEGGNHSGFASYPPSTIYDNIATISSRSQQNQACEKTLRFISRVNRKSLKNGN